MVRVIDQHSDQLFIDMRRATQLIQRLIAGSLSSTISATCVSISAELLIASDILSDSTIRTYIEKRWCNTSQFLQITGLKISNPRYLSI